MTAIPRDPPANTPGVRTLGTASIQAAPGDDSRFPASGVLTVKASYIGTPSATVFYASFDVSGNVITARTPTGVTESATTPGLYFYDQIVSLDQFIAVWDENDGLPPATEVIATRHVVRAPSAPTSVTAAGGNTQATVSFTPGDNGGSAITNYTVTATDSTNALHGGQVQSGAASPIIITGLTNGESYTFTVTATTSFGTSVASAASNAVVPAVVLTAPDPPTGVSAVAGNGQAVVSFTAPTNNGGSAITSYTVHAVDETTPGNGGQTHNGNSPNTITGLVNNEVFHFYVTATNAVGTSAASVNSNSVTPTGAGGGVATFTYTQPSSSTVLLDATGSTGTLVWQVDGVNASATTTTLLIGPLSVGTHTIKLTATSGAAAVSTQSIDVAWVGKPLGDAQHDATNGPGIITSGRGWWGTPNPAGTDGAHSTIELSQWSSLPAVGPWRNKTILNMTGGGGDGVSRITVYDDNHISLTTKNGDHPGSSGGYRQALEHTSSYDATLAGHEFAKVGDIDMCGQGTLNGHGTVRFYRLEMMFPSSNPGGPTSPGGVDGGGPGAGWLNQNNMFEIHGNIGGSSPIRFATNGTGTQVGWAYNSIQGGGNNAGPTQNFDQANILWDTWYNYIVEIIWDIRVGFGYIRVYRDTGTGFAVIPLARCPAGTISTPGADYGKYIPPSPYATQQTDINNTIILLNPQIENYRTRANLINLPAYPDATIHYRNVAVGPTLASVTNL
jgi:hypothetical protein